MSSANETKCPTSPGKEPSKTKQRRNSIYIIEEAQKQKSIDEMKIMGVELPPTPREGSNQ